MITPSRRIVWSEENNQSLDLTKSSDRHHLRFDAATAEDLSIRWADKHFAHSPEYDQQQNECIETLFHGVANQHGVDVFIVRNYSYERDVVVDAAAMLSFGALYAAFAYIVAGRIRRRFPPGEPGFWVMTLTMAVGVSLIGLLVGNLWTIVIETIRLNSAHLSYRMNRIPWRQHSVLIFFCGSIVFVLVSLVRSRVNLRVKT